MKTKEMRAKKLPAGPRDGLGNSDGLRITELQVDNNIKYFYKKNLLWYSLRWQHSVSDRLNFDQIHSCQDYESYKVFFVENFHKFWE